MKLSNSKIKYLKVIDELEDKYRVARVKDISEALSITMPSVSATIRILKNANLVESKKNSFIILTEEGKNIIDEFNKNYDKLVIFCKDVLDMDEESALECAFKLNCDIDKDVINKILKLKK